MHPEWISKTVSIISALLALAVLHLNWKKELAATNRLKGLSRELLNEYEELWWDIKGGKINDETVRKRYGRISKKINPPKGEEPDIKVDEKLRRQCFEAVLLKKGLKKTNE
jgi:hypothetical protein